MGQGIGLACGFWRWFLLRDHFSLAGGAFLFFRRICFFDSAKSLLSSSSGTGS